MGGKSSTEQGGDAEGGVRSRLSRASRKPKPRDTIVGVGAIIDKKGHIPITSRYINDRDLEEFYEVESKVVGSGMSGPVAMATSLEDRKKVAVKSFKKKGLTARKRSELKNEVEIYLSLDHPHVARLDRVFETEDDVHLVMELMAGGELYDRLSQKKTYTEEGAANTTYQMLLAVGYLHSHDIAHRDLKLENFLYESKETDHLKLIDFGFAKFWGHDTKMSQACGSVHYVAPEVLAHSYTPRADMWSLGVIVYMLLTGSPPFHGSDDEVLKKIRAGKPHLSRRFHALSELAQDFVMKLMVFDPKDRLSAEQALQHKWIIDKNSLSKVVIDDEVVKSLRNFAHASSFKRAVLSMMAWSLSTEQRLELREMFLSIDTEKSGTITHSEIKSILEENFHFASLEVEELFKNLDTDNDNEIEYTEFLAAALQGRVKFHQNLLVKTFQKFDPSGTGYITLEDMTEVLGDHFDGKEVQDLVNEADTDKDGKIQYEEFVDFVQKNIFEDSAAQGDKAREDNPPEKDAMKLKVGSLVDGLVKDGNQGKKLMERKHQEPLKIGGV